MLKVMSQQCGHTKMFVESVRLTQHTVNPPQSGITLRLRGISIYPYIRPVITLSYNQPSAKRKDPLPTGGIVKMDAMARAKDSNSDTEDARNVAHEASYARLHDP